MICKDRHDIRDQRESRQKPHGNLCRRKPATELKTSGLENSNVPSVADHSSITTKGHLYYTIYIVGSDAFLEG